MRKIKVFIVCATMLFVGCSAYASTLQIDGISYYINRDSRDPGGTNVIGYSGDSYFASGSTLSGSGGSYYQFRGFSEFPLASWYAIKDTNTITDVNFVADYWRTTTSNPSYIAIYAMTSGYEDGTYAINDNNFYNSIGTFCGWRWPSIYMPQISVGANAFLSDISAGQPWTGVAMKADPEYYTGSGRDVWFTNPHLRIDYEPISTPVPEPATLLLVGMGGLATAFINRKRKA